MLEICIYQVGHGVRLINKRNKIRVIPKTNQSKTKMFWVTKIINLVQEITFDPINYINWSAIMSTHPFDWWKRIGPTILNEIQLLFQVSSMYFNQSGGG